MDLLSPDTSLAVMRASQSEGASLNEKIQKGRFGNDLSKIDEVAQEFEAVFLSEMLKPMFQELKTDGMFGGGKGEEVFRSFLLKEYGDIMSQAGGIGLAAHVKEEIIRMQESQMSEQEFAELKQNTPTEEGQIDDTITQ